MIGVAIGRARSTSQTRNRRSSDGRAGPVAADDVGVAAHRAGEAASRDDCRARGRDQRDAGPTPARDRLRRKPSRPRCDLAPHAAWSADGRMAIAEAGAGVRAELLLRSVAGEGAHVARLSRAARRSGFRRRRRRTRAMACAQSRQRAPHAGRTRLRYDGVAPRALSHHELSAEGSAAAVAAAARGKKARDVMKPPQSGDPDREAAEEFMRAQLKEQEERVPVATVDAALRDQEMRSADLIEKLTQEVRRYPGSMVSRPIILDSGPAGYYVCAEITRWDNGSPSRATI